jgi:hypothetical protein
VRSLGLLAQVLGSTASLGIVGLTSVVHVRLSCARATTPTTLTAKATDEKQTEINWEIALTVWDKVNEDGETG